MNEWITVLNNVSKEKQYNIESQYNEFISMHPNGYIIGIDLSSEPDQTGWIYNGSRVC